MVKRLTSSARVNPLRTRPTPLGSLLNAAGLRLAAELDRALEAAGFPDLRAAHSKLLVVIDGEGTRVTDLAERMGITKQAAGELVRYLARTGYVRVAQDETDQRVKRVALTARGWDAIDAGLVVIAAFDRWLDGAVGADRVRELRDVLARIIETDPADWSTEPIEEPIEG